MNWKYFITDGHKFSTKEKHYPKKNKLKFFFKGVKCIFLRWDITIYNTITIKSITNYNTKPYLLLFTPILGQVVLSWSSGCTMKLSVFVYHIHNFEWKSLFCSLLLLLLSENMGSFLNLLKPFKPICVAALLFHSHISFYSVLDFL